MSYPVLRESVVLARLRGASGRLARAARASRTVRAVAPLGRAVVPRRAEAGADETVHQPPRPPALENSRALRASRAALGTLGRAGRRSRVRGLAGTGRRFVEGSWLYRWLTAEPEPDVVVIDLRETLTVGPPLRAVQRALEWLLPAAVSSTLFGLCRRLHGLVVGRPVQVASVLVAGLAVAVLGVASRLGEPALVGVALLFAVLAVAGSRVTWSWDELRETRAYRLLADAFEPPEPPEPATGSDEPTVEADTDDGGVSDPTSGTDEPREDTRSPSTEGTDRTSR